MLLRSRTRPSLPLSPHQLARRLFRAALDAADAGVATRDALRRHPLPSGPPCWLVALGKAAPAMSAAAVQELRRAGVALAGGLVVGAEDGPTADTTLIRLTGDHPVPGERSAAAAAALDRLTSRVQPADQVLVLLSGGTSALIGAPIDGLPVHALAGLTECLQRVGADIALTNALRRRFARWGGGRLAVALAPATVRCLAVSDVAGDDPAVIGSGPCAGDPLSATDVGELLDRGGAARCLTPALRTVLATMQRGAAPETPEPGDPRLAAVTTSVVLRNADAVRAAARLARGVGAEVVVAADELRGEAAVAGRRCVETLLERAAARTSGSAPLVMLWGGETTVTLGDTAGTGGRCQELALAAAERLAGATGTGSGAGAVAPAGVVLLAAGTDGRDGPTDAAGAMVDGTTWDRIRAAGLDPARALAAHDAYRSLDLAGVLLRTGATGTNVRDVVIALWRGAAGPE